MEDTSFLAFLSFTMKLNTAARSPFILKWTEHICVLLQLQAPATNSHAISSDLPLPNKSKQNIVSSLLIPLISTSCQLNIIRKMRFQKKKYRKHYTNLLVIKVIEVSDTHTNQ